MRSTTALAILTLMALAAASPAAAVAEPRVDGAAGCPEAAQIRNELVKSIGPGAVGTFISSQATSGPRTVAHGTNGYKAFACR